MRFVLASASPRRKELLKEIVEDFEIIPSKMDEQISCAEPKNLVKLLAIGKAEEVFLEGQTDAIVLGADTIVALGREVLGKPKDEQDAVQMLKRLSGRRHAVYTGVCFYYTLAGKQRKKSGVAKTSVYFNELTDEWIQEYVASGSPMDKAGAYGIQDGGLVKTIKGSYSNVVGLPINLCRKLYSKILKELEDDKAGD